MAKNFAEDYVDVATRLVEFREKHPEGSLQPANPSEPLKVITIGEQTFILYTAAAYRTPDDPRPGIGIAWEPFPGKTPFTKDSEAMVCETSAWGRALIAVGAADAKRGIASANEVRNRQGNEPTAPAKAPEETIRERIKSEGLVDAFVAYLAAVHGTNKLDDLDTVTVRELLKMTSSSDGLDHIRDHQPAEASA